MRMLMSVGEHMGQVIQITAVGFTLAISMITS